MLGKKYDVISGDIPEDIVETFIDQIVVHDDYLNGDLEHPQNRCYVKWKETKKITLLFF